MTDKARELLERAFRRLDDRLHDDVKLREEIRAYLAEPEVRRERLSEEEIDTELSRLNTHYYRSFEAGVRWAEKHHGIGGGE